ncbi:MAG: hypothetical protein R2705_11325 [Ilumatobacteraceae bacterium]
MIPTYGDDQRGYPHPDHVKVHDISARAFDWAVIRPGIPKPASALAAVEALLPVWSWRRMIAVHEALLARTGTRPTTAG